MRGPSDALGQLEPSDALAAMPRGSFRLDPRDTLRVFGMIHDRPPGGLTTQVVGLTLGTGCNNRGILGQNTRFSRTI